MRGLSNEEVQQVYGAQGEGKPGGCRQFEKGHFSKAHFSKAHWTGHGKNRKFEKGHFSKAHFSKAHRTNC